MHVARVAASVLATTVTLLAASCGSESSDDPGSSSSGASGASGSGSSSGGFGTSSSSGDNTSSGSSGNNCAATAAQTQKAKVDMVFVIDNSGSMSNEMAQIKTNVNNFASKILNVGLDLHVVFIVARGTGSFQICVPPPLGGANCADNLPTFFHVPQSVGSTNSFALVLSTYDNANATLRWSDKLRPDSTKIFVEVTDDRSNKPYTEFDLELVQKKPDGMFGTHQNGVVQTRKYIWHSIVSKPFAEPVPSSKVCSGAAGQSVDYQQLSKLTGGLIDEVCKTDYSGVLDNIAKNVVEKLGCELTYPKAEAADPTKLVVQFTPSGKPAQALTQVTDVSKCAQVQDGWYYDDNANPTKIILCPTMCTTANATPGSKLEALVGCKAPAPR